MLCLRTWLPVSQEDSPSLLSPQHSALIPPLTISFPVLHPFLPLPFPYEELCKFRVPRPSFPILPFPSARVNEIAWDSAITTATSPSHTLNRAPALDSKHCTTLWAWRFEARRAVKRRPGGAGRVSVPAPAASGVGAPRQTDREGWGRGERVLKSKPGSGSPRPSLPRRASVSPRGRRQRGGPAGGRGAGGVGRAGRPGRRQLHICGPDHNCWESRPGDWRR